MNNPDPAAGTEFVSAGRILELRGTPGVRSAKGSWFTPPETAGELMQKTLKYLPADRLLNILDPSCGSGVFAAAAADYCPEYTFTGIDIDREAVSFCRKYFPDRRNKFLACNTLLTKPENSFDLIIGNPPFVALPNIPTGEREVLRERYTLARGRFNLWAVFVEWTLKALAPGGIGALILPDRLWRNTGDENVRSYLEENSSVLEYGEFPAGTFPDAVVDSGYVIFAAGGKTPPEKRLCNNMGGNDEVFQKIRNISITLGDILDIRDGIIPGHHAGEIFKSDIHGIPHPSYKKLLTGRDIYPGKIIFRNRYVDYRPELWRGSNDKGIRFRKPEIFEAPKILTRQTSDSIIAAWDGTGEYYYANTLHGGRLKTDDYSGDFLAAYLSGAIANYCYRKLTGESGRPFAQVKIAILRTVPVLQCTKAEQQFLLHDMGKIFQFAGIDKRKIIA